MEAIKKAYKDIPYKPFINITMRGTPLTYKTTPITPLNYKESIIFKRSS
ncbi:MAG: hypothetical protein SCALA701_00870 [Candidatus Scalindua sp.]|nr:MAG: hypothetical protein SCALA701_00870 [Candidatus Scalindua sp.]